jgi:hypothetical protein
MIAAQIGPEPPASELMSATDLEVASPMRTTRRPARGR